MDHGGTRKSSKWKRERGFVFGAQMAGALVTKAARLVSGSIGTVTKVTSAYKSTEKTSEHD